MLIGSHVSISGGLLGAAKEAFSYNANTFRRSAKYSKKTSFGVKNTGRHRVYG